MPRDFLSAILKEVLKLFLNINASVTIAPGPVKYMIANFCQIFTHENAKSLHNRSANEHSITSTKITVKNH